MKTFPRSLRGTLLLGCLGSGPNIAIGLPALAMMISSPKAARAGLADYFEFYNLGRLHQALAYRTPAEVYFDPELQRLRTVSTMERELATVG